MKTRFEKINEHHTQTLEKAIQEKKADKQIIPLCKFIAETKNFFTSSSCSGRIALLKIDKQQTKKAASFQKTWHRTAKFPELWKAVQENTDREELWIKQEPFILHIGTNSLENAQKILQIMKTAGIKRGGIQVLEKEKILLEINGTHSLSLPIKKNNKLLVTKEYLKLVLEKANQKMKENQKRLEKFEQECRKELE